MLYITIRILAIGRRHEVSSPSSCAFELLVHIRRLNGFLEAFNGSRFVAFLCKKMIITSFFSIFWLEERKRQKTEKPETARRFVRDGGKDSLLYITASMRKKVDS